MFRVQDGFPHARVEAAKKLILSYKPWWSVILNKMPVVPINVPVPDDGDYGGMTSTDQEMHLFIDTNFAVAAPLEILAGSIERELQRHIRDTWNRFSWLPSDEWDRQVNICIDLEIASSLRKEYSSPGLRRNANIFSAEMVERWGVRGHPSLDGVGWSPSKLDLEEGKSAEEYYQVMNEPINSPQSDEEDEETQESSDEENDDGGSGDFEMQGSDEEQNSDDSDQDSSDSDSDPESDSDEEGDPGDSDEDGSGSSGEWGDDADSDSESGESDGSEGDGAGQEPESQEDEVGGSNGSGASLDSLDSNTTAEGSSNPEPGEDDDEGESDSEGGSGSESGDSNSDGKGSGSQDSSSGEDGPRTPHADRSGDPSESSGAESLSRDAIGNGDPSDLTANPSDTADGYGRGESGSIPNTRMERAELMMNSSPELSWMADDLQSPKTNNEASWSPDEEDQKPGISGVEQREAMEALAESIKSEFPIGGINEKDFHGLTDLMDWADTEKRKSKDHWTNRLRKIASLAADTAQIDGSGDLTYLKRNPNQAQLGPVLMGMIDYAPTIYTVNDQSYSMTVNNGLLRAAEMYLNLTKAIFSRFGDTSLWIGVDTRVRYVGKPANPKKIYKGDLPMLFASGSTDFKDILEDITNGKLKFEGKKYRKPDLMVINTDCKFPWPRSWINSSRPPRGTKIIVCSVIPYSKASRYLPPWINPQKNNFIEVDYR